MNRQQKRSQMKKLKKLNPKQFWEAQNVLHTRAYAAAERQYGEAMDIILTPKLKAAVVAKAAEIRELWDGMPTVTTSDTVAEVFEPHELQLEIKRLEKANAELEARLKECEHHDRASSD